MINSQTIILFILVFLVLLSFSLQKEEEECYKTLTIHFKDDHCPLSPSSYEQLKSASKLCANIAYLGYHEKIEKYFFLTDKFNLIGFEDESNVLTNNIVHEDFNKYNFTVIKSQLVESYLYLLALHNDSYYFITVEISKVDIRDKRIDASIHKLGQRDILFPNLECNNIYFMKAERRAIYLYKKEGSKFNQEKLKTYNYNITSLKQMKPSKFEVLTTEASADRPDILTCEQCLQSKKKFIKKINDEQPKPAIVFISDNIGIVIVLSIFCCFLLVLIIVAGFIYHRRRQKKKAKRKAIKYVESEKFIEDNFHESSTVLTPNISSHLQKDTVIPDNDNATLAGNL